MSRTHHHDRVGAHRACVFNHAVDCVATRVLDQARVLDDLAAPSARREARMLPPRPRLHYDSEHLADRRFTS
jgi:hypothetical protein